MLVRGRAATGRTESLARRLADIVANGIAPDRVLLLARSRATAARLRDRASFLLEEPYEELWIETYEVAAERLLREFALEAGLDPFFTTVRAPDRLAMLLDRLDELPLRRHQIRGNPAGLLARLLRRIDLLKADAIVPDDVRRRAERRGREAETAGERERARRELEFAELYERHDRVLRDSGSLDANDLLVGINALLRNRADVREELGGRFPFVMADELEDAAELHQELLSLLAGESGDLVATCDPVQGIRGIRASPAIERFLSQHPDASEIVLDRSLRGGPSLELATAAVARLAEETIDERGAEEQLDEGSVESGAVRLWRCSGERAQAQAAAREIERLLSSGEVRPERVCVVTGSGWREGRLVAAALEERSVPFRFAGDAALYQRPEVRDAMAWLRMLADPSDSAAVVRAVTRPPIELRSVDLARCTTIARRRKLDMVSALEAALESPQLPPEARDRIHGFLRLYRAAAAVLEEMRADVFVRRLVERIGLRRQRLFAATPEAAERLQSLSRLAEIAAEWTRREPQGSVRDFIRQLTAVADAEELDRADPDVPPPGAVLLAEPEQVKGLEFDYVYLLGLARDSMLSRSLPGRDVERGGKGLARAARLAYVAMTRAGRALVVSWPEGPGDAAGPSPIYETVRDAVAVDEEVHEEELFGPAEDLHSTYRVLRDEVLEASWRAGSALSEMRLDTAEDVNAATARFLELIKLAALIQRPGTEPVAESLAALNELLGRVSSPEQRAALASSVLDEYLVGEERERSARREMVASRREPSLERFIPRRGDGLALSASDIDLYRTCPLKYKFARVFAIPQEPTINQRFGILIHQVLERFHSEELRGAHEVPQFGGPPAGSLDRLLTLFEAGWRRAGFGASDDELQYRDRAVAALARYCERHTNSPARPVWLERSFAFQIGPHHLRGRVDRVDSLPDGGYELIDYKTGERKAAEELSDDVQLALYRLGARQAWQIDSVRGSYWYVLDDERVSVAAAPDDAERVERTVLEAAGGISGQDFEPRPSYEICSWCDYRLICPASEA